MTATKGRRVVEHCNHTPTSDQFRGVGVQRNTYADYYYRFSKGNLHEYTPFDQPNLKTWTDMVTINDYPSIRDGQALAKAANSILDTYKQNKGMVVRTDSVPKTASRPAEHLIVVLFPRAEFIEATFARLLLSSGKGLSIVSSRRVYGKKAGDTMSKWLAANGEKREKDLMAMPVPRH